MEYSGEKRGQNFDSFASRSIFNPVGACRIQFTNTWYRGILREPTDLFPAEVKEPPSLQYIDPAMIGVLVGMALMFIIICVVLRLFSRWATRVVRIECYAYNRHATRTRASNAAVFFSTCAQNKACSVSRLNSRVRLSDAAAVDER